VDGFADVTWRHFTYETMEMLCTFVQQRHGLVGFVSSLLEHSYHMESKGILQWHLRPRHICVLRCWVEMIHGAHVDLRDLQPLETSYYSGLRVFDALRS